MYRRNRQTAGLIISVLLLLALLAACAAPAAQAPAAAAPAATEAPAAAAPAATEAPAAAAPAAAPAASALPADAAEDQTIRYVSRNFGRLNPASEGGFGRPFTAHMWMPFFIRDAANNISPWLATGYKVSDDGLTYTISINPDAVWSDGSPVVAQEAIDYWSWSISKKCDTCYANAQLEVIEGAKAVMDGEAEIIKGLTAIDEKTLQIKLKEQAPIFLHSLAHYNLGFVKMEDVDKDAFEASAKTRVNGPFMVEEWDVDLQKHSVVQNPNWWGEKKPYIQRIVSMPAPDENISLIMWQNDEVDIAHWLTNIREKVRAETPEAFVLIPYATNFYFPLWAPLEPMDDINVRRALLHAVDWDAAVAAAWEGARNERVMKTHLTPELQCFKADNWPDWGYDPELAKKELAASKYGGAEGLPKIRITVGGKSPNYLRMAEIMMEQWKNNLGITDVELRAGSMKDAWGQEADLVNIRRQSWGATIPDSGAMIAALYKYYFKPDMLGLEDAELGAMADELSTLKRDDPEFCNKVQAAEARLLGHHYFLPMIWDLYEYATKPWIKNFDTNVDNNWTNLLDMYIVKH